MDYLHLWTDVTRMYNLYTYCVSQMFVFDVDLMMIIMMMKTYYVYSMFYFKLSSVGVAINNFILFLYTQRGTMLNILARTNIVFNKCVFWIQFIFVHNYCTNNKIIKYYVIV